MQLYKKMYPLMYGYRLYMLKTILLLLCLYALPTLSAQENDVTVVGQNIPVSEILSQIESQTKYSFAFVNSNFNTNRKITIRLHDADLKTVLDQLLADTDYTYTIRKNLIFLSPTKIAKRKENLVHVEDTKESSTVSVEVDKELNEKIKTKPIDLSLLSESKNVILKSISSAKDSLDLNKTVDLLNNLTDWRPTQAKTPLWAVKSNLLFDMTSSIAFGTEVKVGERYSLDVSFSYNPWEFNINKNIKHILVQPEVRYWLCEPFNGHFFGLHAVYAHYNLTGLPFSDYMKNSRLQGDLYGVGFSYGYQWSMSKRWSLEGNFGVGYLHADYDRYACKSCKKFLGTESKNFFAPTKASLSVIYFIK